MNRKMMRLFIIGLLIVSVIIMTGCAAPTPKLGISIKIEASASTWREGEQPYDIYGAIKEKLEEVGFEVVPEESTDYDAILHVDYEETKGAPYTPIGRESIAGYGTNITCDLRLVDKAQSTIFETEIRATTPYQTSGSLYSDAIFMFKTKLYFEYLGEIIASKLGVGGATAVEPLIRALGDENSNVRMEAAKALGELGDATAVEPLIQALGEEDAGVRRYTAEALGKIGDERAVEPLIYALEDEDGNVRIEAAKALGEIGDERAVEPLIQALNDKVPDVRRYAAEALGKIGDARAVEPLIYALDDTYVGDTAKEALGEIGEPAVEPLIQVLTDESTGDFLRWDAREALVEIGEPAVEPLIQAMIQTVKDIDDYYNYILIEPKYALVEIGEPAVELLIQALGNENWCIRAIAAEALGEIGDERAIEPLIQALGDENSEVQYQAEEALKKIRGY